MGLQKEHQVYVEERPMQEEMKYEHMLHEPTVRPKERALFKKSIRKNTQDLRQRWRLRVGTSH